MSGGRRLKVLHVGKFYPPHPGGMESHVADLCAALRDDVDVEVVVSNRGRRTVVETVDGVRVTRVGTLATISAASLNPGMARAIRRARADVVHFHHPNPTGMASVLASGHRGALVVTYHSDIVRQKVLGALIDPLLHFFLRRADAVIASSPEYLATSPVLRRHTERTRVIPFGIDAGALRRAEPDAAAEGRGRFGARVVLGVGRLVYYKGFHYLIRAMARIPGHLLLVGDGPLRGALEQAAREAGVADRVTFLGAVADVRPFYQAADVFVLASVARSEAFGLVQLEAMACGLPVVNTRLGTGVNHVAPHGVAGLTVPPADADALADAINRLLDDAGLRRAYGAAGRERVEREFSRDLMVRRTLDLYHEVGNRP